MMKKVVDITEIEQRIDPVLPLWLGSAAVTAVVGIGGALASGHDHRARLGPTARDLSRQLLALSGPLPWGSIFRHAAARHPRRVVGGGPPYRRNDGHQYLADGNLGDSHRARHAPSLPLVPRRGGRPRPDPCRQGGLSQPPPSLLSGWSSTSPSGECSPGSSTGPRCGRTRHTTRH